MRREAFESGLTQAKIARRARVSQQTIAKFFLGRNQSPTTAKKIARALGHPLKRYVVETAEPPTTDEAVPA